MNIKLSHRARKRFWPATLSVVLTTAVSSSALALDVTANGFINHLDGGYTKQSRQNKLSILAVDLLR
jgi:hypothetical protein